MAPSSRSSSSATATAGPGPMVASLMDQAVQKQRSYLDHVGGNHAHTKMAAMRLALGGQLERLLLLQSSSSSNNDPNTEQDRDVQEFLNVQRQRLQQVAKSNADNDRTVTTFLAVVQQVKQQALHPPVATATASTTVGGDDVDDKAAAATPIDYVQVLQQYMEGQQQQSENDMPSSSSNNISNNNKYVREVLIELKLAKEQVDDDGEIELVDGEEGGNNPTQGASLKCPITSALLEEPYRNTVCGHVYSKDAIFEYIRRQRAGRRPCKCPTAGCGNTNVTEAQLERDGMAEIALNRERRRLDKQRQDRASQASQIDSDYDDEEAELL